jgi:hypothetical protein
MVVAIKPVSAIKRAWNARLELLWRSNFVNQYHGLDHSDARQFRDIFAADHAPHICCLQSGGRWRRRKIPAGLGLRPTGRERFAPKACVLIKTFDPLRARLRNGGFRLRPARAEQRQCGYKFRTANMSPRSCLAYATTRARLRLR